MKQRLPIAIAVAVFLLTGVTAKGAVLHRWQRATLARSIDRYLRPFPMRGSGRALVAAGCRHRVDPRLIVGIAGAETTFGAGAHPSLNVWGNGPGAYMGPSWWAASEQEARNLDRLYFRHGLDSPWRIARRYLGHSDYTGWADKVARVIWNLGGDPARLRVRCVR